MGKGRVLNFFSNWHWFSRKPMPIGIRMVSLGSPNEKEIKLRKRLDNLSEELKKYRISGKEDCVTEAKKFLQKRINEFKRANYSDVFRETFDNKELNNLFSYLRKYSENTYDAFIKIAKELSVIYKELEQKLEPDREKFLIDLSRPYNPAGTSDEKILFDIYTYPIVKQLKAVISLTKQATSDLKQNPAQYKELIKKEWLRRHFIDLLCEIPKLARSNQQYLDQATLDFLDATSFTYLHIADFISRHEVSDVTQKLMNTLLQSLQEFELNNPLVQEPLRKLLGDLGNNFIELVELLSSTDVNQSVTISTDHKLVNSYYPRLANLFWYIEASKDRNEFYQDLEELRNLIPENEKPEIREFFDSILALKEEHTNEEALIKLKQALSLFPETLIGYFRENVASILKLAI